MLGRCGCRITHLGMLWNNVLTGIVFKAGNAAFWRGDRKLPSLIVIRIGSLIAERIRNRNRQTKRIVGVRCGIVRSCRGNSVKLCPGSRYRFPYCRARP